MSEYTSTERASGEADASVYVRACAESVVDGLLVMNIHNCLIIYLIFINDELQSRVLLNYEPNQLHFEL